MKILFIAPKYSGGIGGHAKRVADKLRENGFEIELMYAPHLPIKKLKNLTFAISTQPSYKKSAPPPISNGRQQFVTPVGGEYCEPSA